MIKQRRTCTKLRKLKLAVLILFCLSFLSFPNWSIISAKSTPKKSSSIPNNQWKITGTVKGTGDVSKKFSIRPSNLKALKMGEDMKFEIKSTDSQLTYSLKIPV